MLTEDGGSYREPGQTIFLDLDAAAEEKVAKASAEYDDDSEADSGEAWEDPYESSVAQQASSILPGFRTRDLTDDEKERGVPEVKLL